MTHGRVLNKIRLDQAALFWANRYKNWSKQYEPKLTSYDYELQTSDPHGRISTAAILLTGYCRTLLVYTVSLDLRVRGLSITALFDHNGERYPWKFAPPYEYVHPGLGQRWSDDTAESGKVKRLTALQIGMTLPSIVSMQPLALMMLVLEAVGEAANEYKRIVIIEMELPDEEMLSEKWETKDIRMV